MLETSCENPQTFQVWLLNICIMEGLKPSTGSAAMAKHQSEQLAGTAGLSTEHTLFQQKKLKGRGPLRTGNKLFCSR